LRAWMPWAYDDPVPLGQMAERLRRFRANFDRGERGRGPAQGGCSSRC
jgi:hypothetical protein